MKSRTIEIIDNHIEALEEELEWYQKKNIEWQEKCEKLEKQNLIETYPDFMMFLRKPIDYWQALQHYDDINCVDKLLAENTKLKQVAANHHNNWMTSQQENARLRDQLRWRDAKKEPPNKSGYYFTKFGGIIDITYYNYTSTYGWECDNNVLKWLPIPEGGDA